MHTRPIRALWPRVLHRLARVLVAGTWIVAKYEAQVVPLERVLVITWL